MIDYVLDYEVFTDILGMKAGVERVDVVRGKAGEPLWIHVDLGRRLRAFPRQLWRAFVYDPEHGLLFIYEPAPRRFLGVVYPDITIMDACIMLEYASVVDMSCGTNWSVREFGGLTTQLTVTHLHDPKKYFVHRNTLIPFPFPVAARPESDDS